MDGDKLYSVEDAAVFLGGLSKYTIHAWLSSGKLRRTKVGARTMVRESDLRAFLASCNPDAVAPATAAPADGRHSQGARKEGSE